MLSFLFPTLTAAEPRGAKLFAAAVAEARKPFWYADLQVPDTLDGRFSLLASVTALAIVRLERGGETEQQASVALTERFIESMDHEHRQLGYGDPTIGKIVRKLTGSLARRVERFRSAIDGGTSWEEAAIPSINSLEEAEQRIKAEAARALETLWRRLELVPDEQLLVGDWG
jgi:cytochrome b pre-mRNA-processing protein 3